MGRDRNITFRRIRGRLVPIKLSKRQRKGAEGAALVGAGTFGALKLGRLSGIKRRHAAATEQMAFKFGQGKAGISAMEGLVPGARQAKKAARQLSHSKALFGFGRVTSAAAIGLGVEKLIASSGIEQTSFAPEFLSEVAGVGAASLVEAGSRKGFEGTRLRHQALEAARRNAPKAKSAAMKIARAILKKKTGI